jgi:NAD(P)-dependent dehydrogenase (short-subunit alcohol dehydrogenase family)
MAWRQTPAKELKMDPQPNVLVTGTNSGFGFLIARTLLQHGYTVLATMRDLQYKNAAAASDLLMVAKETEGQLHLLEVDVANEGSVNAAVKQALEQVPVIDVAINNAGFGVGGYGETVSDEQFRHQFEVNVFGVQRVIRAVLPSMRAQGEGLIINISSIMGRIVIPFALPYTASKYALEGLSESYRYELAGTGVDVVVVEPGGFKTSFRANMQRGSETQRLETYGDLAEAPNTMWRDIEARMATDAAPDPQAVADAVLKLIQTPAGQRPLRTVVDPMMGGEAPSAVNRATDEIQQGLYERMGMQHMLQVKVK